MKVIQFIVARPQIPGTINQHFVQRQLCFAALSSALWKWYKALLQKCEIIYPVREVPYFSGIGMFNIALITSRHLILLWSICLLFFIHEKAGFWDPHAVFSVRFYTSFSTFNLVKRLSLRFLWTLQDILSRSRKLQRSGGTKLWRGSGTSSENSKFVYDCRFRNKNYL
jgi:hypothetical protein